MSHLDVRYLDGKNEVKSSRALEGNVRPKLLHHGILIPLGGTSEVLVPWHRVIDVMSVNSRGEIEELSQP